MALYRGEPILGSLIGHLVPPDDRYPDCRCALVLTRLWLYTLEDNYDGTCTEHFAIPTRDVLRIERFGRVISAGGIEEAMAQPQGLRGLMYRLTGPVARARRDPDSVQSAEEYVRVRYHTADDREASLYFSEMGSPYFLSRKLAKCRQGLGYRADV